MWQWGQFIDHDMTLVLTDVGDVGDIPVPAGDPYFDPSTSGVQVIQFSRSIYAPGSGVAAATNNPRQQINILTAYLDGSQVYGSDTNRARELRAFAAAAGRSRSVVYTCRSFTNRTAAWFACFNSASPVSSSPHLPVRRQLADVTHWAGHPALPAWNC